MQIWGSSFVVLALLAACQSSDTRSPSPVDSDWLRDARQQVVPRVSDRLDGSDVMELDPDKEALPVEWLASSSLHASPLSDVPRALLDSRSELGTSIYVVRAMSCSSSGRFSVYRNESSLVVFSNHMGQGGSPERRALLVRSPVPIAAVYGGCSGAM